LNEIHPKCCQYPVERIALDCQLWRNCAFDLQDSGMFGITDLGVFLAGTIAIVLLPGPNSLYVLAVSSRGGARLGYAGALGIFLGDAGLMILTAAGASSILHAHPILFHLVRWSGAAYLAFLGIKLLLDARRTLRGNGGQSLLTSLKPVAESSFFSVVRKATVISLLNPKAIFFYLSFFVQFVDPNYAYPGLSFLALGCIVETASMLYLAALVGASVRLAQSLSGNRRISVFLNTAVGLLFIGFGARLAS